MAKQSLKLSDKLAGLTALLLLIIPMVAAIKLVPADIPHNHDPGSITDCTKNNQSLCR